MKEFPEWKITLAEGIKNVKTVGTSNWRVRVQTNDHDTGLEVLGVIKQNIQHIPPGSYEKITGTAYNCRDFTIHFNQGGRSKTFVQSIEDIQKEYGDYKNCRGEYAVSETESGEDGDSPNSMITVILVIFVAAIAYYLWKQAG